MSGADFFVGLLRPDGAIFTSPRQSPGNAIEGKSEALKGRYPANHALSGLIFWVRCIPRALPWAFPSPPRWGSKCTIRAARFVRSGTILVLLACASLHAEVQIERVFLPHAASPSSFAIGLPGGVNFCFDPVRGAVSYAWTGGFLDLSPARPGPAKFMHAAKLLGPVVYQETGVAPLRRGDPARAPVVEFTGYTLHAAAVEFRYTIDGVLVREDVRAATGGAGLIRRFTIAGGSDAKWWHVVEGRPPTELKREGRDTFVLELPFGKAAK